MAERKKEDGNKAFQAGDMAKAVELYTEAIALDDMNHVFYANRAAAYLSLKKFEEARADSKKCIALDPSFAKAYLRLASAEKGLGNKAQALEIVKQGMALFGDAGGKKAKKTGLNEFKKLEKELKNALNPSRAQTANPVEQAVRSASSQQTQQGAQELGQKVISQQYKLSDVQGRTQQRLRDHQSKQIVLRTLEQQFLADKDDSKIGTYRRMGKAYLMQPCSKVMSDLKSEMEGLESEVVTLKKGETVLKRQLTEANQNLDDFLARQRQQ